MLSCSRPGCARTTTHPSARCFDHRGPTRAQGPIPAAPPPPFAQAPPARTVVMPFWLLPPKSAVAAVDRQVAAMLGAGYRGDGRSPFLVEAFVSRVRAAGVRAATHPKVAKVDEHAWAGAMGRDPGAIAAYERGEDIELLPDGSSVLSDASIWAQMGFGPDDVLAWKGASVGVAPSARHLADHGWSPELWAQVDTPAFAGKLTPARHIEVHVSAEDAAIAAGASADPASSAAMLSHGWSPGEVAVLRAGGADAGDSRSGREGGLSAQGIVAALRDGVPLSWAAAGVL